MRLGRSMPTRGWLRDSANRVGPPRLPRHPRYQPRCSGNGLPCRFPNRMASIRVGETAGQAAAATDLRENADGVVRESGRSRPVSYNGGRAQSPRRLHPVSPVVLRPGQSPQPRLQRLQSSGDKTFCKALRVYDKRENGAITIALLTTIA